MEIALTRIKEVLDHGKTELNLVGLGLDVLPKELFECSNLKLINLKNNNLRELPSDFLKLEKLQKLLLAHNNLTELNDEIFELKSLWFLEVDYNGIVKVNPKIGNLKRLALLSMTNNFIEELPETLGNLTLLQTLNLRGNKLKKLPKSINGLKKLKHLSLGLNQIEELPKEIKGLTNLEKLNLSGNNLTKIPYELCDLKKLYGFEQKARTIKPYLVLSNNPLNTPPIEIAVKGLAAISDYFDSLSKASEINYLYESKLILVGEGEVGKTSLAKTLTNSEYKLDKELRTEGIDIIDWKFPISKFENTNHVNIHIWDFGGQEIYHSTHQFFLTTRSIYLFVLNPRRDENINTYYYWLNIIKLLGGNSPVIVVINKSDIYKREFTLDEFKEFNENVIGMIKTSCETRVGIEDLNDEIKKCLSNLEHLGSPLDKRWIEVKKELEILRKYKNKDIISLVEFECICKSFGIEESDIFKLSDIFHTLGIFIHYQNDIRLQNIIILNPEWATHGVYRVLDNEKVKNQNGYFSDSDVDSIWNEQEFKYHKAELLALMSKFELCFELKNGSKYLAPQLLSKQPIKLEWKKNDNIHYEYHYDFMPKGLLSHFIVKQNEDILDNCYWLNGVVLSWNETKAIVTEHYIDKKIKISLEGSDKKHFLAIIKKTFYDIHKRYHNLKVKESIGCTCVDCKKIDEPFFHNVETIKLAQKKNIKELQCQRFFNQIDLSSLQHLIEDLKVEDGLQGSFFESIVKTMLKTIYPNSDIRQSVTMSNYEFDFIVISEQFKEIVVVEAKGYKAKQIIEKGDNKTKQTLLWFYENTFPYASNQLKKLFSSPLYKGFEIKACYVSSCSFSDDSLSYFSNIESVIKPTQLDCFYDRKKIVELLEKLGLKQQLLELNRYYS